MLLKFIKDIKLEFDIPGFAKRREVSFFCRYVYGILNLRPLSDDSFKREITHRSPKDEEVIARKHCAGKNTLFWQVANQAATKLSRSEIKDLPEVIQKAVADSRIFIR